MSKRRYFRDLVPPWQMPSDPVKAVWWFMYWLLKVLVHFFWMAILGMVIYESVSNWRLDGAWNGVSSGVITLLGNDHLGHLVRFISVCQYRLKCCANCQRTQSISTNIFFSL